MFTSRFVFTSLPLEIIVEILKAVHWSALLRIRQTCKHINIISRTRMVWYGQFYQYVADHKYSIRLEEPLESYSAEELERWVLVRRSADVAWKRKDLRTFRRVIRCSDIGAVCIVPGGRWLLVGGITRSSVTAYDLDAPQLTGTALIPLDEQDKQCVQHIAVNVDSMQQSSNLTFTMALSPGAYMDQFPLHVNTWKVTLVGHGKDAQLVANRLHSFQAHKLCVISDIALHDKYYARTLCRGTFCYLEVYDLERSSSEAHCKAMIFPGVIILDIRFLPGDRLLALSEDCIMVYGFAIAEGLDPVAPTIAPSITQPIWRQSLANLRLHRDGLSNGISDGLTTRFFLAAGNQLSSLIIPTNDKQAPHISKLTAPTSDKGSRLTSVIGVEKAFIKYGDSTAMRLGYVWDDQEFSGTWSLVVASCVCDIFKDYPIHYDRYWPPNLDEETGRIVQDTQDMIYIFDTALLSV